MFERPLDAGLTEEVRWAKSMFWEVHSPWAIEMDAQEFQMQVKMMELDP
jgi:hypothetical protein